MNGPQVFLQYEGFGLVLPASPIAARRLVSAPLRELRREGILRLCVEFGNRPAVYRGYAGELRARPCVAALRVRPRSTRRRRGQSGPKRAGADPGDDDGSADEDDRRAQIDRAVIPSKSASGLQPHAAAAVFPPLAPDQLRALAHDILRQGLLHPIILHEGAVLDGWNRLLACELAGVEPRFKQWRGFGDPIAWAVATNLKRRHLTPSQKAIVAADTLHLFEEEARTRQVAGLKRGTVIPVSAALRERGKASEDAADALGVSPRYVELAREIARSSAALLKKVRAGALTLNQAKKQIARRRQLQRVAVYVPPTGSYPVVVCDPAWPYDDHLDGSDLVGGGTPYPTMRLAEIEALKIPAAPDCVLWLWTTNTHLPHAYQMLSAWGFTPRTLLTWVKNRVGMGRWLRGQTEHCILAVKGHPVVTLANQSTALHAKVREHSRKPDEFFKLVESLCPAEPKLEMFAREQRDGWTCTGAELEGAIGIIGSPSEVKTRGSK